MPTRIVVISQHGSEASAMAAQLGSRLAGAKLSEVTFDELEQTQGANLIIIAADDLTNATRLMQKVEQVVANGKRRVLLAGISYRSESHDAPLSIDSVVELLEEHRPVGLLPPKAITAWKPILSGFIGRKDLMDWFHTNCMKDTQSANYCSWVHTPGNTAADFIAQLANVMGSTLPLQTSSNLPVHEIPSKNAENDVHFFLDILERGSRDDRAITLQNLAQSPTGDRRVQEALELLLEDNAPCLLQIPYRFGEIRLLAGVALVAERSVWNDKSPLLLRCIPPVTPDELEEKRITAGLAMSANHKDPVEYWLNLFAVLRDNGLMKEVDFELRHPVFLGWLGPATKNKI
jgi:hypothetical protein